MEVNVLLAFVSLCNCIIFRVLISDLKLIEWYIYITLPCDVTFSVSDLTGRGLNKRTFVLDQATEAA